jgi:hypothetical protein
LDNPLQVIHNHRKLAIECNVILIANKELKKLNVSELITKRSINKDEIGREITLLGQKRLPTGLWCESQKKGRQ